MGTDTQVVENMIEQLKAWNIEITRTAVSQKIETIKATMKIINDLRSHIQQENQSPLKINTSDRQRKIKLFVDLSLEENKIIFDRLSKI
jgi:hypothetical protein